MFPFAFIVNRIFTRFTSCFCSEGTEGTFFCLTFFIKAKAKEQKTKVSYKKKMYTNKIKNKSSY